MAAGVSNLPAGSIQNFQQTVGTSAVALGSNGGLAGRGYITIYNAGGGGVLFVGGPNVAIGQGMAIASNATPLQFPTPQGESVYGIASLAGTVVSTIEG